MKNIVTKLDGNKLTLTIDVGPAALAAASPSASGKTKVVATTSGNVPVTLPGGQIMSIGVNAYVKP